MIKFIQLDINGLRNISVNFTSPYELMKYLCKSTGSLYSFQKTFTESVSNIKANNPAIKKVCIPLKNGGHTDLDTLIFIASALRLQLHSYYGSML